MTQSEAKAVIFGIVNQYFKAVTIAWSNQNRTAIPKKPFIRLTAGNLKRNRFPAVSVIDGVQVNTYACRFSTQIDLFTNGRDIPGSEQRENTAVDDLMSFVDFMDSEYVSDACDRNGIEISLESDVIDLSAAIYDANYEFRAEISLGVSFMHRAVGYTGAYGEETVKEAPETGEDTIDLTEPFEPSASGGNTQELARETDCGYFTAVEITDDRSED